jgi:hypothetical protein
MTQHLAPCPLSSPPAGRKVETRQGETSFAPPHVSITNYRGGGWLAFCGSCNPFAPRVEGNPKGLCAAAHGHMGRSLRE